MQQLASHDQLKFLRALYRERFDAFAQAAFDIVNPSQKFEWNWHIECLTEHLMAVEHGEIKSLIINLPPRNLKSFLVSIAFPAWCFARNSHSQFIVASHSLQPLAEKLSSDTRRLIESDWYKKLFPEVVLDKAMATQLVTSDNGHRLAISAFQSPTGVGADCFVAGTMVTVFGGEKDIKDICVGDQVLSYCHKTNRYMFRKVVATRVKSSRNIIKLRTNNGRKIKCTADHRFYLEDVGGYVEANRIQPENRLSGKRIIPDSLCSLQKGNSYKTLRYAEENRKELSGYILWPRMFFKASFLQKLKVMSCLPKKLCSEWKCLLLKRMQETRFGKEEENNNNSMQGMQKGFCKKTLQSNVLFERLQKFKSFKKYDWSGKFELFRKSKIWSTLFSNAPPCDGERCNGMLCMWKEIKASCSSYRSRSEKQSCGKYDNTMSFLPFESSSFESDSVSSIERLSGTEELVYDIQVEGAHNFFAEGLLVHNCIILDDINKPDEALSDVIRTGVNGWIDNTAMSRFNDRRTGRFICVQQRVHENDATGHILSKGGDVVHLVLPIQNRTGKDIVIKLGNKVWTMKDGDYLHKERFTPEIVADIERDLGSYPFAGQYLQSPVPIGGGMLKQEWVKYYNKVNPRTMNVYILCDPANISNDPNLSIARRREKKSDWTAFVVVGLNTDGNKYLLDVVRDKFNPTERIDALFELHRKWSGLAGRPAKVGYEKYGMMTDTHYIQLKMEEENYRFNMIELGGSMSKVDRIGRLIPDLERGNWYFPNKIMYTDSRGLTFDLVSEIIKTEMEMFPVSKHDDCLDALSRIYSEELNATFPRLKKPDLIGSSETINDATDAWVGW